MQLAELYRRESPVVSIELFPPKSSAGDEALVGHVDKMMAFSPDFITCTYGAGGSTRDKTLEIVSRIKRQFGIPVATHLTLVGSSVAQLRSYLQQARDHEIDYVVALRGDPPRGQSTFNPQPGGLRYASQLVQLIRAEFPDYGIAVAGYPEKHQEAANLEVDVGHLKTKVDAGAAVVLTQLFYDNTDFWRFRERCELTGITVPIVPGILPITNFSQVQRITQLCGSKIPSELSQRLAERDDPQWQAQVGIEHARKQVESLLQNGVPGLHFYVLNQSQAMLELFDAIPRHSTRA